MHRGGRIKPPIDLPAQAVGHAKAAALPIRKKFIGTINVKIAIGSFNLE